MSNVKVKEFFTDTYLVNDGKIALGDSVERNDRLYFKPARQSESAVTDYAKTIDGYVDTVTYNNTVTQLFFMDDNYYGLENTQYRNEDAYCLSLCYFTQVIGENCYLIPFPKRGSRGAEIGELVLYTTAEELFAYFSRYSSDIAKVDENNGQILVKCYYRGI